jgi:hypothetical protein
MGGEDNVRMTILNGDEVQLPLVNWFRKQTTRALLTTTIPTRGRRAVYAIHGTVKGHHERTTPNVYLGTDGQAYTGQFEAPTGGAICGGTGAVLVGRCSHSNCRFLGGPLPRVVSRQGQGYHCLQITPSDDERNNRPVWME